MKTRDVQRGIVSPHASLHSGGTLDFDRMFQEREGDLLAGNYRRRKRASSAKPVRGNAFLISSVLSVVTLGVIGMVVVTWLLPYVFNRTISAAGPLVYDESRIKVTSKFPSPGREETLDRVRRAITNRDPESLESLFRMGAASRAEVLDFLKTSDQRDGIVERYEWLSSMDVGGLLLEGVLVVYQGREKPVERLAFLTPDQAGIWKMDFEAFARTASPSWKSLLENGADKATVRVFVGKDVYYNGPFADDKRWVCYGIASPDTDGVMRGYCQVGSALAKSMGKMFSDGRKLSRATLEIRRVNGGGPRQFEIIRLLSQDWVLADDKS
jgi:hypothetical protein